MRRNCRLARMSPFWPPSCIKALKFSARITVPAVRRLSIEWRWVVIEGPSALRRERRYWRISTEAPLRPQFHWLVNRQSGDGEPHIAANAASSPSPLGEVLDRSDRPPRPVCNSHAHVHLVMGYSFTMFYLHTHARPHSARISPCGANNVGHQICTPRVDQPRIIATKCEVSPGG
jgi:hypothetical protein